MYVSVAEFKKNYVPKLSIATIKRLAKEGVLVCVYSGSWLRINPDASLEKLNSHTDAKPLAKEQPTEYEECEIKGNVTSLSKPTKHPGKLPEKLRNKNNCLEAVKEVSK